MKNVCVLGIGSPFGDDQLGWEVVDALSNDNSLQKYMPQSLQLNKLDRPGLLLLSYLQDVDTVIIIDAMVSDGKVGMIHRLCNQEITLMKNLISSHHISIPEALKLGDKLNMLPRKIVLYGIEIDPCYLNNGISEKVKLSINHLIHTIHQEIMELLTDVYPPRTSRCDF